MNTSQKFTPMNPYFFPVTTGFVSSSATLRVFQPVQTTAGQIIVPLRVVNLQRDLDRKSDEQVRAQSALATEVLRALSHRNAVPPKEEISVDTRRVLNVELAAQEWELMTEQAGADVQLPSDID